MTDDDNNGFDEPVVNEEGSEEEMEILKEVLETDHSSTPGEQIFSVDLFADKEEQPAPQDSAKAAEDGTSASREDQESLQQPFENIYPEEPPEQTRQTTGPAEANDIKVVTEDDLRSLFEESSPGLAPEENTESADAGPDPQADSSAEEPVEQRPAWEEDEQVTEMKSPASIPEEKDETGQADISSEEPGPDEKDEPEDTQTGELYPPASELPEEPEERKSGPADEDSMSPLPEDVEEIDFESDELGGGMSAEPPVQEEPEPPEPEPVEQESAEPEPLEELQHEETSGSGQMEEEQLHEEQEQKREEEEAGPFPEAEEEAKAPAEESKELTEDVLDNLEEEARVGDFAAVAAAKKGEMLKATEDKLSALEPAECDFMSVDELRKLFDNVNLLVQWVKETSERIAKLEKKVEELGKEKDDT